MPARFKYVPTLRTKAAEWDALRLLAPAVRTSMTPCLEILPAELEFQGYGAAVGLPEAMNRFVRMIARNWGAAPVLVDPVHIKPSVRSRTGEHLCVAVWPDPKSG